MVARYAQQILDFIQASDGHPTAEDIFLELKSKNSQIVLATVYNNLNALCKQGKIRRISMGNGCDRYDRVTRHDHLICSKCGSLCDVFLSDLSAELEKELGCAIESYDLRINYVCEACRGGESKNLE